MTINEITNQFVKIGQTTITIKNPKDNKTMGVVRNIKRFKNLRLNQQVDFIKDLRACGIWGSNENLINNVILVDNKLYYLYDIKRDRIFNCFYKDRKGFEQEKKSYNEYVNIVKKASKYMFVIRCYIM